MPEIQNALNLNGSGPETVLVKFFFTNERYIPRGIPENQNALAVSTSDKLHAREAKKSGNAELGQVGRHREGRVDTGTPVIQSLPMSQAGFLRTGLANNGYRLIDAHWFTRRTGDPKKKPKQVVCLTFKRAGEGDQSISLANDTTKALRELANTTWMACHVWDNGDNPATINFVGRQWDDKNNRYQAPKNALVVRNRQMRAIAVVNPVDEVDE